MFGQSLSLKCEGFDVAGSIKLKAATEMVEAAERNGVLEPGSMIIESFSGNLGVALSMIAASKQLAGTPPANGAARDWTCCRRRRHHRTSTGTVASGATDWLARHDARELTAVPAPRTSASATATPFTTATGCTTSTARTCSGSDEPTAYPRSARQPSRTERN